MSAVVFGRIEERWDRVVICGQGPSWKHVHPEWLSRARRLGAWVIAVNGAIDHTPADMWFSLDMSPDNMARMRRRVARARYVAAVPDTFGTEDAPCSWQRGDVPQGVTYLRRIVRAEPKDGSFEERILYQIVGGLSEDPGAIHTGNSGFGALGLAYHLRPSRIVLLGIDGRGRKRWDGTVNGPLDHMPELFRGAVDQLDRAGIEVVNGSMTSHVRCFRQCAPSMALGWLLA